MDVMKDRETTGDAIKRVRKRKGFTQAKLADRMFVTRSAVSHWEQGVRVPSSEDLVRISIILGVSLAEFKPKLQSNRYGRK